LARDRCGTVRRLAEAWPDGRIKLAVIATLLEYRRGHPDLFADGSYEPVMVEGAQGDRLCCFVRQRDDAAVLVAASRFPGASEGADAPVNDTVPIPACLQKAPLRELLTGRAVSVEDGGAAAVCRSAGGGSGPGINGGNCTTGPLATRKARMIVPWRCSDGRWLARQPSGRPLPPQGCPRHQQRLRASAAAQRHLPKEILWGERRGNGTIVAANKPTGAPCRSQIQMT
jgi:hypothetical protein